MLVYLQEDRGLPQNPTHTANTLTIMSGWQNRLGPQGRALLNGRRIAATHSGPSFEPSYSSVHPQDLDFLVNDLRNPPKDITVRHILSYLYQYVPYVKNQHNLRVIISSFLNNPLCFGPLADFENNYLIIEVFKLITDTKLKVSRPTLSVKDWYIIVARELTNFVSYSPQENGWKVLPIIAGICLSNKLRDELYTHANVLQYKWFFKEWDDRMHTLFRKSLDYSLSSSLPATITNLSLICLAVKYNKDENVKRYIHKERIPYIVAGLSELILTNTSVYQRFFEVDPSLDCEQFIQAEILQKPVPKNLNRLSFLLENCLSELSINDGCNDLIIQVLDNIISFNRTLNHLTRNSQFNQPPPPSSGESGPHEQFWFHMKTILFGQILIFQGILNRFLKSSTDSGLTFFANPFKRHVPYLVEREYREVSLKILQNLYYINHILVSIGQGGFDSYNFVYYLSLELALSEDLSTRRFEHMTRTMISHYEEINSNPHVLNRDYVARAKVLFVFGLWENYLQQNKKNDGYIHEVIYDTTFHLVRADLYNDHAMIEAGHSVLLNYFSYKREVVDINESLKYVKLLFLQFPSILSSNQLSIAIETLGKKVLSRPVVYKDGPFRNSVEEFLWFLLGECSATPSGMPVISKDNAFSSAQPVSEIDAASTMSHIDEKSSPSTDIIDQNKKKKPKDRVKYAFLPPKTKHRPTHRTVSETSREALISSFINLVPYFPLSSFTFWLDEIKKQIDVSNGPEKEYLTGVLWKVLSENLDLNRCAIAFEWWYEGVRAVERPEMEVKL